MSNNMVSAAAGETGGSAEKTLWVRPVADFEITGDGRAAAWGETEWTLLPQRRGPEGGYITEIKLLYSTTGIYFLFRCQDRLLTAAMDSDFMDLWNEDVVEVFLWPDEHFPIYFEYEISPLDHELLLLVPNLDGQFWGWTPWHYEGDRRVRHATSVKGGQKASQAAVEGWSAEFYIPFELLSPLTNVPPRAGTQWRANFYRCDYDREPHATWAWQAVEKRFHEYKKFGTLIFL